MSAILDRQQRKARVQGKSFHHERRSCLLGVCIHTMNPSSSNRRMMTLGVFGPRIRIGFSVSALDFF